MELHDLPIRPAFCEDERHAPGRAKGLAVADTSQRVQTRNGDSSVRQHDCRVLSQLRSAWPVVEKRVFEVGANSFCFDHDGLARGSHKQGIRSMELHDGIDIGICECLRPFLSTCSASSFGPAIAADESDTSKVTADR